MPARPVGVYPDGKGGWYLKVTLGSDHVTGRREQLTRRGFRTATEAGVARRELVAQIDRGQLKPVARGTTVNQLLDLYLDGLDADGRLSAKTRFDYRHLADVREIGRLDSRRQTDCARLGDFPLVAEDLRDALE